MKCVCGKEFKGRKGKNYCSIVCKKKDAYKKAKKRSEEILKEARKLITWH